MDKIIPQEEFNAWFANMQELFYTKFGNSRLQRFRRMFYRTKAEKAFWIMPLFAWSGGYPEMGVRIQS